MRDTQILLTHDGTCYKRGMYTILWECNEDTPNLGETIVRKILNGFLRPGKKVI